MFVFSKDSNKANRSEETDEDEVIRDEIPGMSEKAAKPEDKVQAYLGNHEGDETVIIKHKTNCMK